VAVLAPFRPGSGTARIAVCPADRKSFRLISLLMKKIAHRPAQTLATIRRELRRSFSPKIRHAVHLDPSAAPGIFEFGPNSLPTPPFPTPAPNLNPVNNDYLPRPRFS